MNGKLDKFDYAEPSCPLCGGADFYYPEKDAPLGHIPVERIISKVDSLFDKNDYREAGRLLVYWCDEAVSLKDRRGELAMESELVGYYRKQNDRENGIKSVSRALMLTEMLGQSDMASGATVLINCATAYKAFDMPEDAMPLYLKAETVYKKLLPDTDARFGGLYNNMALALSDLGRFSEAEEAYCTAIKVMETVEGGELECAITYVNLAHMYEKSGESEKIDDCMVLAAKLLWSENLKHDGYYAFVLEKCAPSFSYFGFKSVGEEFKKESEAIYERS